MGDLPAQEASLAGESGRGGSRGASGAEPGGARPAARSSGQSVRHPAENYSAEDKYKIWMRHRYNECVESLAELLGHDAFPLKVGAEPAAVTPAPRGPWRCTGIHCSGVSVWEGRRCCGTSLRSGSPLLTSPHRFPSKERPS